MTPQNLRSISRQLYSDSPSFSAARPLVRPSNHFGQYSAIKIKIKALHLAWVNDFITVNCFAAHHGLTRPNALRVINIGRKLNS